jgi:hypothetical protein
MLRRDPSRIAPGVRVVHVRVDDRDDRVEAGEIHAIVAFQAEGFRIPIEPRVVKESDLYEI